MVGVMQRSFAGGYISVGLGGRADTVKYATGAADISRMAVLRDGTVSNDPGTEYVATAASNINQTKLQRFVFNDDQAYVLEVGEYSIRFFREGAVLIAEPDVWLDATNYVPGDLVESDSAAGTFFYCVATHLSADLVNDPDTAGTDDNFWYPLTAYDADNCLVEVPTPYIRGDLAELTFAQSADVVTITHPNYPPHELIRTSHTHWTLLPKRFGPTLAAPTGIALKSGGSGSADVLRYKVTAIQRDTYQESLPGASGSGGGSGNVVDPVSGSPLDVTVVGHGLYSGDDAYISAVVTQSTSRANENAVIALKDLVFRATLVGANQFTLDDTEGLLTNPTIATSFPPINITIAPAFLTLVKTLPTVDAGASHITLTWTPPATGSVQEYWIYRSVNDGPYGYIGKADSVDSVTDKPVFTDDGIAADFESGPPVYKNPFREGDWPRTSAYFQQRQWFAGTDDHPQKVWGSVTGDFVNFSTHTPLQDDDAIEFSVQENEVNEIYHLAVLGRLLILTRGGILSPRGDASGAITPLAISLETLSSDGCANVRPVMVGDGMLFVERSGTIIREMRYDLANGGFAGYIGRDITVYATPLFDGETISDMVYAPSPDSIVYVRMADGRLLGLTYLREHDIWAWHSHPASGSFARIRGITVIPEAGIDTLYVLARRTINGSAVRYIERTKPRESHWTSYNGRTSPWYLDSALQYDGTNLKTVAGVLSQDSSLEMTLTGGTTWAAGEAGLTLTADSAAFPGDASNIGNGYRLGSGSLVEVVVTGDASTTAQTVTLITACPAALQGVATNSWVRMVDDISGMDHLEAETVGVLADGLPLALTSSVISGGAISLGAANGGRAGGYGIILIGLPYNCDLELLPLDAVQANDAWIDRYRSVIGIGVLLRASRGFSAGEDSSTIEAWVPEPEYTASYTAPSVPPLITDTVRMGVTTTINRMGKILIRQADPLPLTVLSVVRDVKLAEKGRA